MKGSRFLFLASWIILLVVAVAVALISLQSLRIAYTGNQDSLITGFTLEQIREHGGEEAVKAFKGRRATAATWALGYALLALMVVLGPYRRGERWAWWALLISIGVSQLMSILRVPMLGTTFGTGAPAMILAFTLLGLLAGAPNFFRRPDTAIDDVEVR
ncbi:MAG TPA: hypothetical protein VJX74_22140 [Blastocatellia bacterium]|nr:hypothetical protein [Blastocatellia bacterium]